MSRTIEEISVGTTSGADYREQLRKVHADLDAARSTISEQEKRIAEMEAERDYARSQHDEIIKADTKHWFAQRDRAAAAEQTLTSERQRREEAENVAKPLADVLNEGLRVGAIGPDSEDTDSLYVQLSVLRAAQAYLRKYEPIPADREEERDGK
jgi:multidrug resistance efflux pump